MMTRRTTWVTLLASLTLASAARSQEAYAIKPPRDTVKGDSGLYARTETRNSLTRTIHENGQVLLRKRETIKEVWQYEWAILEVDGKKPTHLRRRYEIAQVTTNGRTEILPYQGEAVIITWKDDKYQFRLEGGRELTGREARFFKKEFNDKKPGNEPFNEYQDILPPKAVQAGDSWTIDIKPWIKAVGADEKDIDVSRAVATGKLLNVHEKTGRPFAVIQLSRALPFNALGAATAEGGCQMTLKSKLDCCMDGRALAGDAAWTLEWQGTWLVPRNDGKAKMIFSDTTVVEEAWRDFTQR